MIVIEFLDEMSNRDGCWNEIETFMNSTESNGADLLLMMGTVSNGENRGFGWWAGPKETRFQKERRTEKLPRLSGRIPRAYHQSGEPCSFGVIAIT